MSLYPGNPPSRVRLIALALAPACALFQPTAYSAVLEEVIVTAQKREQNMMDVPVALTAVTPEDLLSYGVRDTADLTKISPSLTYDQTGLAQNSGFRIRGIGTVVYSVSAESAVAVVIDDVATTQSGQALADLTDIERVEILRGPQSTLFGRNASAGVINVVTKGPTEELEASTELTLTDDDQEKITASLSGPLGDSLGYRLTGYYDELDGWITNIGPGGDTDGSERWGVNTRLDWDVSDSAVLKFQAKYDDSESACCSSTLASVEDIEAFQILTVVPITDAAPELIPTIDEDNTTVSLDDVTEIISESLQLSLKAEVEIGDHDFVSITAYSNWKLDEFNELDLTSTNLIDYPFTGFTPGGTIGDPFDEGTMPFTIASNGGVVQLNQLDVDFFSQEFRLLSPQAEWGEYIAGFYYSEMDADRKFDRYAPGLGVIAGLDNHNLAKNVVSSASVFGQVTFNIGDSSRVTLGGRYQYEEIEFDRTQIDFYGGTAPMEASFDDDDTIALGSIAFQHDIGESGMAFARYARGHKGQFFDAAASNEETFVEGLEPVAKESSDAFEVGYKGQLFDNRFRLELVGFFTTYDDYQAQETTLTDAGAVIFSTENVGELETYGLELDTTTLIGENFTLQVAAAWVDATITEYPLAECYFGQTEAQGCVVNEDGLEVQDLAGKDLQNSPDFKFNLAGTYVWPAGDVLPGDVIANASYAWTDGVNHDLQLAPWMEDDSYGILNLALGMQVFGDVNYTVTLFANNVLDESYNSGLLDLSLTAATVATARFVPRDHERYFGLRVNIGI